LRESYKTLLASCSSQILIQGLPANAHFSGRFALSYPRYYFLMKIDYLLGFYCDFIRFISSSTSLLDGVALMIKS
jgi:hypothetical protein